MTFEECNPMQTHMSPEGLEEAVQLESSFMVTLTQGEKYRIYSQTPGSDKWTPSPECFNTEDEAKVALGQRLVLLGAMMSDPKKTLDVLLKAMEKRQ